jgi:hypothetical protein
MPAAIPAAFSRVPCRALQEASGAAPHDGDFQ